MSLPSFSKVTIGEHAIRLSTRSGGFSPSPQSMLLAASLPSITGTKVLDIGCGTGIQSIVAAHCGASEIHGIDIQEADVQLVLWSA